MVHTSERILDAAEKIYRTEGAEALSMRRMAGDLGVTATALYRHYKGKEDLLDAVADRGFEELAGNFRVAMKKRTARSRLLALFETFRTFALERPALCDLMFFRRRAGARRFPGDFTPGSSPTGDILVGLLTELRVKEPLDASLVLWAEAQGLMSLQRAGRFESDTAFRRAWDRSFERLLALVS